ncbi:hypothetical protein QCA50_010618 [Cerrena zonata]|uniref:Uncharacterized protein n=1 Tax=Cerrena zonata TaxID=2478898 RepID=A0AAW0G7X5_9APHY
MRFLLLFPFACLFVRFASSYYFGFGLCFFRSSLGNCHSSDPFKIHPPHALICSRPLTFLPSYKPLSYFLRVITFYPSLRTFFFYSSHPFHYTPFIASHPLLLFSPTLSLYYTVSQPLPICTSHTSPSSTYTMINGPISGSSVSLSLPSSSFFSIGFFFYFNPTPTSSFFYTLLVIVENKFFLFLFVFPHELEQYKYKFAMNSVCMDLILV